VRLGAEEDAQCFEPLAKNAEVVWEANWARKAWAFKREQVPLGMKWQDVLSVMLVADYPCAQQERFGVWDQGGVVSPTFPFSLLPSTHTLHSWDPGGVVSHPPASLASFHLPSCLPLSLLNQLHTLPTCHT